MTTPPVFCANSSARADLPLAVGPAISTALLKLSEFACMSLVATLICNPANPALDTTIVDGALAVLPSPGTAQWLFDEVAVDIPFDSPVKRPDDIKAIETRLQQARGDLPIDIVVQPVAFRRKKLFLADMDSTMIGQECIDELADFAGLKAHVAGITERAMRGEMAEPILGRAIKLATLIELRESFDLDEIDTLVTGDGANDLGMIQAAGLGVAYHAKPAVAAAAAARIDYGDLSALLYAQGYRREEFAD